MPRPKGNRILKKNANLTESTLLADSSLPGLVAAHTYTQAGQGVRGRAVPVGRVGCGAWASFEINKKRTALL